MQQLEARDAQSYEPNRSNTQDFTRLPTLANQATGLAYAKDPNFQPATLQANPSQNYPPAPQNYPPPPQNYLPAQNYTPPPQQAMPTYDASPNFHYPSMPVHGSAEYEALINHAAPAVLQQLARAGYQHPGSALHPSLWGSSLGGIGLPPQLLGSLPPLGGSNVINIYQGSVSNTVGSNNNTKTSQGNNINNTKVDSHNQTTQNANQTTTTSNNQTSINKTNTVTQSVSGAVPGGLKMRARVEDDDDSKKSPPQTTPSTARPINPGPQKPEQPNIREPLPEIPRRKAPPPAAPAPVVVTFKALPPEQIRSRVNFIEFRLFKKCLELLKAYTEISWNAPHVVLLESLLRWIAQCTYDTSGDKHSVGINLFACTYLAASMDDHFQLPFTCSIEFALHYSAHIKLRIEQWMLQVQQRPEKHAPQNAFATWLDSPIKFEHPPNEMHNYLFHGFFQSSLLQFRTCCLIYWHIFAMAVGFLVRVGTFGRRYQSSEAYQIALLWIATIILITLSWVCCKPTDKSWYSFAVNLWGLILAGCFGWVMPSFTVFMVGCSLVLTIAYHFANKQHARTQNWGFRVTTVVVFVGLLIVNFSFIINASFGSVVGALIFWQIFLTLSNNLPQTKLFYRLHTLPSAELLERHQYVMATANIYSGVLMGAVAMVCWLLLGLYTLLRRVLGRPADGNTEVSPSRLLSLEDPSRIPWIKERLTYLWCLMTINLSSWHHKGHDNLCQPNTSQITEEQRKNKDYRVSI